MTTIRDFGGELEWPLDNYFGLSQNFMVTALGSCVKWPYFGVHWPSIS